MGVTIQILLSENLYLRDPNQTELGQRILSHSIDLIDELGFEAFTFKKLAKAIGSTEASVYRYFENKHKLLIYLVAWYWAWLELTIDYQVHNITDPKHRLRLALQVLANAHEEDMRFPHINEAALHRIVVAESSKTFLTKGVQGERDKGLFQGYISLVEKLAGIFREMNPRYRHPKALAVTMVQTSRKQQFFASHLPNVTELGSPDEGKDAIIEFLEDLVMKALSD
jgi:AcrR family transcriptional regulator